MIDNIGRRSGIEKVREYGKDLLRVIYADRYDFGEVFTDIARCPTCLYLHIETWSSEMTIITCVDPYTFVYCKCVLLTKMLALDI